MLGAPACISSHVSISRNYYQPLRTAALARVHLSWRTRQVRMPQPRAVHKIPSGKLGWRRARSESVPQRFVETHRCNGGICPAPAAAVAALSRSAASRLSRSTM